MIVEPERYVEDFAQGRRRHPQRPRRGVACTCTAPCSRSEALGKRAGVSLNPHTPIDVLRRRAARLASVLIMSVNPGFGGQAFIPAVVPKIRALRAEIDRRGLAGRYRGRRRHHPDTAPLVCEAGANVLIAGAAVFGRRTTRLP